MSSQNIEMQIRSKLSSGLSSEFLEILNESSNHNVPKDAETHFKITLVSAQFDGLSRVKRHQHIYQLLDEELKGEVHALALHLYTPDEWQGISPDSPKCLGGEKTS